MLRIVHEKRTIFHGNDNPRKLQRSDETYSFESIGVQYKFFWEAGVIDRQCQGSPHGVTV